MADAIQFNSQLPNVAQMILGQQNRTGQGSTSTSTTVGNANIDPLMQVFQTAMGQAGMGMDGYQALINSIFQQGAQQVPSIIGAYANATGSRASNNSGIKLAMDELNRQMTTQAMTAILQNQQQATATAGQAAGNVANATRQTTSTQTGNTNTTQKQSVGNPNAGLGTMLAGFLLNQADKRGMLNGLLGKNSGGMSVPSTYGVVDPSVSSMLNGNSGPVVDPFAGQASLQMPNFGQSAGMLFGANPQVGFDFGMGDMSMGGMQPPAGVATDVMGMGGGSMDMGDVGFNFGSDMWGGGSGMDANYFDPTNWGTDIGAGFDFGLSDSWDWGSVGDSFSFRNGGRVNPRMRAPGYANGGTVAPMRRNVNYTGSRPSPVRTGAVNYTDQGMDTVAPAVTGGTSSGFSNSVVTQMLTRAMESGGKSGVANPRPELLPMGGGRITPFAGTGGVTGINAGMGMGPIGTPAQNNAAVAGLVASMASTMTGIPGMAITAALDALGIPTMSMNPISQAITFAINAAQDPMGQAATVASNANTAPTASDDAAAVANSIAADQGIDPMDALVGMLSEPTMMGGGAGDAGSVGGPPGTASDATGGDSGSDSVSSDAGGAPAGVASDFKNGGLVRGPGTSTSDSIRVAAKDPGMPTVRYSNNEFVIPAEVVRMTGAAPWQALVNAFNTPKA